MEQFDSEKARRVWSRVQAGALPESPHCDVQALAVREAAENGAYIRLSQSVYGRDRALLRKIAMEDKAHWEILRGILRMTAETKPKPAPPAADSGSVGRRLRLCYGRKMQMVAEYEKRVSDPQFGRIFQKLAEQEAAHCQALLTMIGKY